MTDKQFEDLCKTYGFAPSRDLRAMIDAALNLMRSTETKVDPNANP